MDKIAKIALFGCFVAITSFKLVDICTIPSNDFNNSMCKELQQVSKKADSLFHEYYSTHQRIDSIGDGQSFKLMFDLESRVGCYVKNLSDEQQLVFFHVWLENIDRFRYWAKIQRSYVSILMDSSIPMHQAKVTVEKNYLATIEITYPIDIAKDDLSIWRSQLLATKSYSCLIEIEW